MTGLKIVFIIPSIGPTFEYLFRASWKGKIEITYFSLEFVFISSLERFEKKVIVNRIEIARPGASFAIKRQARRRPDLRWLRDLATEEAQAWFSVSWRATARQVSAQPRPC